MARRFPERVNVRLADQDRARLATLERTLPLPQSVLLRELVRRGLELVEQRGPGALVTALVPGVLAVPPAPAPVELVAAHAPPAPPAPPRAEPRPVPGRTGLAVERPAPAPVRPNTTTPSTSAPADGSAWWEQPT
jgi:hypothetical protein